MKVTTKIKQLPSAFLRSATILGQHTQLPIDQARALNDNVVVMGSSGTGKTYSFVKPNLLQMNTNYVVADAKGEILADVGSTLKQNGYNIRVLNLVDLKHSMSYNPLKYIADDQQLLSFADSVITSSDSGEKTSTTDPFWVNAPRELLVALISFVREFLPENDHNMNTVINLFNMLDQPGTANYDPDFMETHLGYQLFNWARKQNPKSYAVRKWDTVTGVARAHTTWASIVGILGTALAPYEMRDVINLTYDDSLDFATLLKPKTALFVMYDDADSSKNFISNVFYKQLFAFLFHESRKYPHQKLPEKVRFFLDDFKNVTIPGFEDYLATARSRNLSVCIMLQDESQLKAKYHEAAPSIIGNCATYVLTGTTDLAMAERASRRFQMTPQEIRRLPREYFLLDMAGNIKRDLRYDFTRHPAYNHMVYRLSDEIKIVDHVNQRDPRIKRTSLDDLVATIKNAYAGNNQPQEIDFTLNSFRDTILDSVAEKWMSNLLTQMFVHTNFKVNPQVHLSSIFVANGASLAQKRKNNEMSVDFLITGTDYRPLLGIEVDGPQHFMGQGAAKQALNDEYKNRSFYLNSIPLLRVYADGNYMQDHAVEIAKTIKKMLVASMKVEVGANPIRLYPPVTYDSLIHETTHLPSADLTQRLTMLNNNGEFANN